MKAIKALLAGLLAMLALQQFLLAVIVAALVFQHLPLHSANWVLDSKPFPCETSVVPKTIAWKSPGFMLIRRARLWLGMDMGSIADFGYTVRRKRGDVLLFNGNWDHYADPTGLNDEIELADFTPGFILLRPGDELELLYYCVNFGKTAARGHAVVILWYPGF